MNFPNVKTIINPAMYHGYSKKPPFFEGWYYKLVSIDGHHRLAIIPGVIKGKNAHTFIQILDGSTGESLYFTYPIEKFQTSRDDFIIDIAGNHFTINSINLKINQPHHKIFAELAFDAITPWPVKFVSPGVMGWYAWVPGMECYHGVLSFNHNISGNVLINSNVLDFTGGTGYIEKDWGKSFPSAWVWFQSNHFQTTGSCLTASVATIPWMKSSFTGFIIGFWHKNVLHRFATYTGAKIIHLDVLEHEIEWGVEDGNFILEMIVHQAPGGTILGPTIVDMGKRVTETMDGVVELELRTKTGELLVSEKGLYTGLEVNGDIIHLLADIDN